VIVVETHLQRAKRAAEREEEEQKKRDDQRSEPSATEDAK
jgi:hypothetical protein